jgi:hypothetical protein
MAGNDVPRIDFERFSNVEAQSIKGSHKSKDVAVKTWNNHWNLFRNVAKGVEVKAEDFTDDNLTTFMTAHWRRHRSSSSAVWRKRR